MWLLILRLKEVEWQWLHQRWEKKRGWLLEQKWLVVMMLSKMQGSTEVDLLEGLL